MGHVWLGREGKKDKERVMSPGTAGRGRERDFTAGRTDKEEKKENKYKEELPPSFFPLDAVLASDAKRPSLPPFPLFLLRFMTSSLFFFPPFPPLVISLPAPLLLTIAKREREKEGR